MAGKRYRLERPPEPSKQPDKCKGCTIGRWDGVKQFCMTPQCIKHWFRGEGRERL